MNSNKLVLEISIPKQEFIESERLYVDVRLRNISDENVTVYKELYHGENLRFNITRNEVEIPSDFSIYSLNDVQKENFLVLEPNSFYGRSFFIGKAFYPGINKPGLIQITAEYRNYTYTNGEKFGLNAWCGKLFSLPLEFKIIE